MDVKNTYSTHKRHDTKSLTVSGFCPCTLTGHITHGTARLIARHGHGISTWTCCNMHEQLKLQLRRVQLVQQPIAAVLGRPLDDHLAPKRTRPVGERDDRTSCQRRGIDPRNGLHTPIAMQQPLSHVPSKKTHPAMQSTAVTVPIRPCPCSPPSCRARRRVRPKRPTSSAKSRGSLPARERHHGSSSSTRDGRAEADDGNSNAREALLQACLTCSRRRLVASPEPSPG